MFELSISFLTRAANNKFVTEKRDENIYFIAVRNILIHQEANFLILKILSNLCTRVGIDFIACVEY